MPPVVAVKYAAPKSWITILNLPVGTAHVPVVGLEEGVQVVFVIVFVAVFVLTCVLTVLIVFVMGFAVFFVTVKVEQ